MSDTADASGGQEVAGLNPVSPIFYKRFTENDLQQGRPRGLASFLGPEILFLRQKSAKQVTSTAASALAANTQTSRVIGATTIAKPRFILTDRDGCELGRIIDSTARDLDRTAIELKQRLVATAD